MNSNYIVYKNYPHSDGSYNVVPVEYRQITKYNGEKYYGLITNHHLVRFCLKVKNESPLVVVRSKLS